MKTWDQLDAYLHRKRLSITLVADRLGVGRSTYYRRVRSCEPVRLTLEEHAWLHAYLGLDTAVQPVPTADVAVTQLDELVTENGRRRREAQAADTPQVPTMAGMATSDLQPDTHLDLPYHLKKLPQRPLEVQPEVDRLRVALQKELMRGNGPKRTEAWVNEKRLTPLVPGRHQLREGEVDVYLSILELLKDHPRERMVFGLLIFFQFYAQMA